MPSQQTDDSAPTIQSVSSWKELHFLLEDYFCGNQWIFRGQQRSAWPLETKLERILPRSTQRRPHAEQYLLREFQRRLHHYRPDVPALDDTLEWFALMQHHGAPTRLLDWTKSPYVAAYFAVEDCASDKPCSIWVMDRQRMRNEMLADYPGIGDAIQASVTKSVGDKSVFNTFFLRSTLAVFAAEPFRMNERMSVQQGVFLVPTSVEHTFLTNLKHRTGGDPSPTPWLCRIDLALNSDARLKVLQELRKMNIHRASLFPGIDGFAQSLTTEIEIWSSFDLDKTLTEGEYNDFG